MPTDTRPSPTRTCARRWSAWAGCVLAAALAMAGCRGGGPDGEGVGEPLETQQLEDVNGIEVRVWTFDPLGATLERTLAPFVVSNSLDAEIVSVWRDHGFRLVEIPVGLVLGLEDSLRHVDTVRRVWLGQPTRWSDLTTSTLASDGGALGGRSTPVRATLSARSWIEPVVRRGPIRLELALTGIPLDRTGTGPLLMRDLLISLRLEPGMALAIVPATPDEEWLVAPPPDGTEPQSETREAPEVGPEPPSPSGVTTEAGAGVAVVPPPPGGATGPETVGPLLELPVSLGESMLITPNGIASRPPRPSKRVVVIVPGAR